MRRRLTILAAGAALLLGAAACSDDDDGGMFGGAGGNGGGGGELPGPSGGGGGFDDTSMGLFVEQCDTFPGTSRSLCECAWGEITGSVSTSEYAAFEEQFLADPSTPLPSWLTDAVTACSDDT
ncbi:MAG TPA: hypothetical protein VIL36_08415 [Acidimicrobiales bacterium]